jgi:hypothetical protein
MDILFITLGQIMFGFVIACFLLASVFIVRELLGINKQPIDYMYEFDVAEVRRPGAWQYDHDYFDKIEEFQNDFS